MKKLLFACMLAAVISPAFSTTKPVIQYCNCTGIGMPKDEVVTIDKLGGIQHKNPVEIFILKMRLWIYLYRL